MRCNFVLFTICFGLILYSDEEADIFRWCYKAELNRVRNNTRNFYRMIDFIKICSKKWIEYFIKRRDYYCRIADSGVDLEKYHSSQQLRHDFNMAIEMLKARKD